MTMSESFEQAYKEAKAELAKLRPKYDHLTNLIATLEKLFELDGDRPKKGKGKTPITIALNPSAFAGLQLQEAVMLILRQAAQTLTTRDVTAALENVAFQHKSKNLWNTVNTTLDRLRTKHGLVGKDKEGWFLTDKGKGVETADGLPLS